MKHSLSRAFLVLLGMTVGYFITGCQTVPSPTAATPAAAKATPADSLTPTEPLHPETGKPLPPPPEFVASLIAQPIPDGDPLKVNWAGIVASPLTLDGMGEPVSNRKAALQTAHDGERLYLQIVEHTDTTKLIAAENKDRDLWKVVLGKKTGALWELVVDADGRLSGVDSSSTVQLQAQKDPMMWTLSLSVPLNEMTNLASHEVPAVVRLNVLRYAGDAAKPLLALSPTLALPPELLAAQLAVGRLEQPAPIIAPIPPPMDNGE